MYVARANPRCHRSGELYDMWLTVGRRWVCDPCARHQTIEDWWGREGN